MLMKSVFYFMYKFLERRAIFKNIDKIPLELGYTGLKQKSELNSHYNF